MDTDYKPRKLGKSRKADRVWKNCGIPNLDFDAI